MSPTLTATIAALACAFPVAVTAYVLGVSNGYADGLDTGRRLAEPVGFTKGYRAGADEMLQKFAAETRKQEEERERREQQRREDAYVAEAERTIELAKRAWELKELDGGRL